MSEDEELVGDEVEWRTDADGTEWFVEDGVRYELADDGYAYPMGPAGERDQTAERDETVEQPAPERPTPEPAADRTVRIRSATSRSPFTPEGARTGTTGTSRAPGGAVVLDIGTPPARGDQTASESARPRQAAANGHTAGHGARLLTLSGVRSGYGQLPVLHGVDLEVAAGETLVILGLNGAGKTTTALNICGSLKTWGGSIDLEGTEITKWSTRKCVNAGIVMVPEGRRVFPDLTVDRNLQIGAWSQRSDTDWIDEQRDRVFGYFPQLRDRTGQVAGTLSGGEQQMLAIARGLMARPRLLIIDEASMGLAPVIVSDVFDIVRQINADGVTVLMIEQNVAVLDVADVALVMEQGRIVREMRGEELRDRDEVTAAVMG